MSTVDFAASAGATNQFKQLGRKRGLNWVLSFCSFLVALINSLTSGKMMMMMMMMMMMGTS